ncbi:hypothetical protein [Rhodobacter sp. SY28-1]|uniref:hypothetical protein n=1 Tax=Rhodobacter sp. SY28-1 TaxID=2562317 RepID=UPI0010C02BFB|nr:hypothetical protein [Rhodobacter sp. SY28-1]
MIRPGLFALLVAFALPAQADELAPVLADYWTNSGSLPPEYAWETSVLIREDGQLELKHCKGYETEGPACKQRTAKVSDTALAAIRAAATESGLIERPANETDTPMVGGGLTWGRVNLAAGTVELPSQPSDADVERVNKVLATIADAIPPRFDRFTDPD